MTKVNDSRSAAVLEWRMNSKMADQIMRKIFSVVFVAMAASSAPAWSGPATAVPAAPINPAVRTTTLHEPTNFELLQAINSLTDQVTQLQGQLAAVQNKLDDAQKKEQEDYQRISWRVVQACKVAYLRSWKAGDNPSSGAGGNPFTPDAWCDIGSYPYWKSMQ